jgi:hypothetical protein
MGISRKYKFREEFFKHLLNGILQGKRNLQSAILLASSK